MLEVGLAQKAREAKVKAAKENKSMETEEVEPTAAGERRTLPSFSGGGDQARGEASCPPKPCIKRERMTDDRIIEKLRALAAPVPLDLHPDIGIPGPHITLRVVLGPEDDSSARYGGEFWLSICPDALPKYFNRAHRDLFRLLISIYLNEGLIPCNGVEPIDYVGDDKDYKHFHKVLAYATAEMLCAEQWEEAFREVRLIFGPIFPAPIFHVHESELDSRVTLVDITMDRALIAEVMTNAAWRWRLHGRAEAAAETGGEDQ